MLMKAVVPIKSVAYHLLILSSFLLSACGEEPGHLDAPNVRMSLPVSLTGTVSTGGQAASSPSLTKDIANNTTAITASDTDCHNNGANQENWMENGYTLTTFLVGISQSQSCFADMIISGVAANGATLVNKGLYTIPNPEVSGPTHVEIQETGGAYHVWIYFNEAGLAELSQVHTLYITWSTLGTDSTGRFIMANSPFDVNDPGAPDRVRVDFSRGSSGDTNSIYMGFPEPHSIGINGFRVDVSKTGSADSASYLAKGLISLTNQLDLNGALQFSSESFAADTPSMTMVAYAGADENGAAISKFNDIAMHIGDELNTFNLGSYRYTTEDRSYFTSAAAIEWQRFTVAPAVYVNVTEGNSRIEHEPDWLSSVASWLSLDSNYFTDTCTEVDGVDCSAFMQAFYDIGIFDGTMGGTNSSETEPNDVRTAQLDDAVQFELSELWPIGTTSITAFTIPTAN